MASTMETDESYADGNTSPEAKKGEQTMSLEVELPWWADVIESTELAHVIRNSCEQKVWETHFFHCHLNVESCIFTFTLSQVSSPPQFHIQYLLIGTIG